MKAPLVAASCFVAWTVMLSACGSPVPSVTPPPPPPLAIEPCDAEVLADAIAAIEAVDGYRFTYEIWWPRAPMRVGENRIWTRTRSHGAYLAPDRYWEEVLSTDDPLGPGTGYWEAVGIGDRAWWLVSEQSGDGREWRAVAPDRNGGNVLMAARAYADAAGLSPGAAPASLPGEGGCVLVENLVDRGEVGSVAIRLDAAARRVVAFSVDSEETRLFIEVRYDVPSRDEFEEPTNVSGE